MITIPHVSVLLLLAAVCEPSEAMPHSYGSQRPCETDDECDLGSFCFDRYTQAICWPCVDCRSNRKKNPPNGCAHNTSECGPCVDGFTPQGTHCIADQNKEKTTERTRGLGEKNSTDVPATPNGWTMVNVVAISLTAGVLITVFLGISIYCGLKHHLHTKVYRRCRKSARGANSGNLQSGLTEEALQPSAPLEYFPPPYNPNLSVPIAASIPKPMTEVVLISNESQKAYPFSYGDYGHSYGQSAYYQLPQQQGHGNEDEIFEEDEVDDGQVAALFFGHEDPIPIPEPDAGIPLEEVSIHLEGGNGIDAEVDELMDLTDDSVVPEIEMFDAVQQDQPLVANVAPQGEFNDSGFSNSTSCSGLDQVVPETSDSSWNLSRVKDYLNAHIVNRQHTSPSQATNTEPLLPAGVVIVEEIPQPPLPNVYFSNSNPSPNDSGYSFDSTSYPQGSSPNAGGGG